ncbi:hypothetical protein AAC387_Pa12g1149 [Persea americana]
MNRQRKDKRKEVVDTSNLMLLAEVCCEEIERITLEKKKESERIAPNLMLLAEVSCQELERITLEKEKETEKIGRPRRLFPSHSKNNDHKKARAIPLPLPSTNENAKSVASKPCSSRMAATKGAHDNQQRQQSLPRRRGSRIAADCRGTISDKIIFGKRWYMKKEIRCNRDSKIPEVTFTFAPKEFS